MSRTRNHRENPLVKRLKRLDACAVSDALDRLGVAGTVNGIPPLTGPVRIAGRVITVTLGPAGGDIAPRHLCTAAIEAAEPGDVIVIEHRQRADAAGWGGILANAAKVRGIAGVIVDGAARDIDEARSIGFPVFARSAVASTARGRVAEYATNAAVVIGGVTVRPGDLVIADSSGAVFLRAEQAAEVIAAAEDIAGREAAMTEAVLAGEPVTKVMGRSYEAMLVRKK